MSRIMGDATHQNVPLLAAVKSELDMVAGYVTGTSAIVWVTSDWAEFTGLVLVTIDQGYQSPPTTTATVRDVEEDAWTVAAAVDLSTWDAVRPTIYCDQSTLTQVLAAGWQGDLWLAIPGWQDGAALPSTPGCNVVAVQSQQNVDGAYDLSTVLDPTWPEVSADMPLILWAADGAYMIDGGKLHAIKSQADYDLYTAAGVPVAGSSSGSRISAAEFTQLQSDFPPGNPPVTVTVT